MRRREPRSSSGCSRPSGSRARVRRATSVTHPRRRPEHPPASWRIGPGGGGQPRSAPRPPRRRLRRRASARPASCARRPPGRRVPRPQTHRARGGRRRREREPARGRPGHPAPVEPARPHAGSDRTTTDGCPRLCGPRGRARPRRGLRGALRDGSSLLLRRRRGGSWFPGVADGQVEPQRPGERDPTAVDAGLHRADGHAEDARDLVVRQILDIG